MIFLAIGLLLIGMTDLVVGGLAGEPGPRRRLAHGAITGSLALLGGIWCLWLIRELYVAIVYSLVLWMADFVWVDSRTTVRGREAGDTRPARLVAGLAAVAVAIVMSAFVMPAMFTEVPLDRIETYLRQLPWIGIRDAGAESVLLTIALLIFLGPTSNSIVRSCLEAVRTTPVAESEKQLKGGRLIGPLERWLIFGLALAGEPTAAALVISAKSIIRFPELQSKRDAQFPASHSRRPAAHPIDELTEYFLLGSLLSWSLALAASLPF